MRTAISIAVLLVAIALAMRAFAISRDLFVDEIRSLFFADWARSLAGVFRIQHDNNHLLNTLWLHVAGPGHSALFYRTPAFLAGLCSLAASAAIGLRRSRAEALILLALVGTSNLIVHYSTEARGYAFAICAQLLAMLALERGLSSQGGARTRWSLAYQASILVGLLAHLSFAVAVVALASYQLASSIEPGSAPILRRVRLRELLGWNLVPGVFALALYLGFARGMQIGGAPETNNLFEMLGTAANAIGFASAGSDLWVGASLAMVLGAVALAALARDRDPRLVLYGMGLFVAPALALWVRPTSFVQPRYFLPSVVFFLLLLGGWAAELYRSGRKERIFALAVVGLFVAANIVLTLPLFRDGQGEYPRGMALMAEESPGAEFTMGSQRPAHDQIVFEFYARGLPTGKALRFVTARDWPAEGPEWLTLLHDPERPVKPKVRDERGNTYRLRDTFTASPRAGLPWLLYRNSEAGS